MHGTVDTRYTVRFFLPVAFLLIAGGRCGQDRIADGAVVRDSAGITIVENSAPAWAEGEGWRVTTDPLVSIGRVDGPEPYRFSRVRGAVRLRSGEIVVADFSTNQIRWFGPDGTFLRAVGRKGGGPGEFDMILGMWRMRGDSSAVFDFGNARMTVLTPGGELGRVYRPEQARALARPVGPFGDGSFLARAHWTGTERERGEGLHRDTILFVRWTPTGSFADSLARRPDEERYHGSVAGRSIMGAPPFARGFCVAVGEDHWYYGVTETYEIEGYSKGGELRRLIRREVAERSVTPADAERWRTHVREVFSQVPEVFQDWHGNLPLPETLPVHGDCIVDQEGNLWVAEYSLDDQPTGWSVFDPGGHFLGGVALPDGVRVTQIGPDFVVGVWRDALDVEQVRVYRLIKDR